jgi:hypothetical protein
MRAGASAFALILLIGLCAGCSRHDDSSGGVSQDLRNVGHDVSNEARKVGHDPDVKQAGSELKAAGHDIAQDLRQAGSQAKSAAHDAAHDVNRDTKGDHHDNRDTQRNDNNS